jgi:hypothetical protein
MTGAEHYIKAEEALNTAGEIADVINEAVKAGDLKRMSDISVATKVPAMALAIAQVHATLALAAATAYPAIHDHVGDESSDGRDWTNATAPKRVFS